jgi:hypothetical protein
MSAKPIIHLAIAVDDSVAHIMRMLSEQPDPNPRTILSNLAKRLPAYASGIKRSKFFIRIDSSEEGAAQGLLESGTPTITITFANITAGETILIGSVTLTWAVAAANENEVTIGANLAAATTNLAAAIAAHSKLMGLVDVVSAVTATGVVTLRYLGDPRAATLLTLSETGDAVACSATSFDGDTDDEVGTWWDVQDLGID